MSVECWGNGLEDTVSAHLHMPHYRTDRPAAILKPQQSYPSRCIASPCSSSLVPVCHRKCLHLLVPHIHPMCIATAFTSPESKHCQAHKMHHARPNMGPHCESVTFPALTDTFLIHQSTVKSHDRQTRPLVQSPCQHSMMLLCI